MVEVKYWLPDSYENREEARTYASNDTEECLLENEQYREFLANEILEHVYHNEDGWEWMRPDELFKLLIGIGDIVFEVEVRSEVQLRFSIHSTKVFIPDFAGVLVVEGGRR